MKKKDIKIEKINPNVLLIELRNSFDEKSIRQFIKLVKPELKNIKYAIFDIRKLDFIDGVGCHAFRSFQTSFKSVGGTIRLCNVPESLVPIFRLNRLEKSISIHNTLEEAVIATAVN